MVVETTTVPTNPGSISSSDDESRGERPPPSMSSAPQTHHITRVKATATVKVEVHTPIPGNCIIHLYHNLLKFLVSITEKFSNYFVSFQGAVESINHDHVYKSKRRKNRDPEAPESDSGSKS